MSKGTDVLINAQNEKDYYTHEMFKINIDIKYTSIFS